MTFQKHPATLLFAAALTGMAAQSAVAQRAGSSYSIAPVLRSSAGGDLAFAVNLQPAVFDQGSETIATTPTTGQPIVASEVLTSLGGDNYRLRLLVLANDNLAPAGYPVNGFASDFFGLAIGPSITGGIPLEFDNDRAAFITRADLYVLNFGGSVAIGPVDARPALNLYEPNVGGGWDGDATLLFNQSALPGTVGGYELLIEYRLGNASEYQQIFNTGCAAGTSPTLEPISETVIGRPMTIEADVLPSGANYLWLMASNTMNNGFNLASVGGPPFCNVMIDTPFATEFMTVQGNSATVTLQIPYLLSLSGLRFGIQGVGIGLPLQGFNGMFVTNAGRLTLGG